jgi:cell shape-determining protein MreC
MNSFQQNRRSRRTLVLVTVIVFMLVASDFASGGFIRKSVRDVVGILNGVVMKIALTVSDSKPLASRKTLLDENKKLRAEIDRLSSFKIQNELLRAENEALGNLLGVGENRSGGITARILSTLTSSPFSTIVVESGEESGVSVGDYVVIEGGIAIGFISEVGKRTSLVTLFTAPSEKTGILLGNASVEMVGRGGGNAVAELPRDIEISEDGLVPLKGSKFAVGIVGRIESSPADAFQKVFINVPTSIESQEFAQIFWNI